MRVLLLVIAASSCLFSVLAFSVQPFGMRTTTTLARDTTTRRFMFSTDNDNNNESKKSSATTMSSSSSTTVDSSPLKDVSDSFQTAVDKAVVEPVKGTLVKNLNTGEIKEVKWVDPAMRANTKPWEMSWWAYFLLSFPPLILLNDVFHFLPTEGPLGWLGRI